MNRDEITRDEQLDAIASRLRSQNVPPVPPELLQVAGESTQEPVLNDDGRPRSPHLAWTAMAAAAIILVAAWLRWPVDQNDRPEQRPSVAERTTPTNSGKQTVRVIEISQLKPYSSMESELNQLEVELAALKQQASRLDVYRTADMLLAEFSTLGEEQ